MQTLFEILGLSSVASIIEKVKKATTKVSRKEATALLMEAISLFGMISDDIRSCHRYLTNKDSDAIEDMLTTAEIELFQGITQVAMAVSAPQGYAKGPENAFRKVYKALKLIFELPMVINVSRMQLE